MGSQVIRSPRLAARPGRRSRIAGVAALTIVGATAAAGALSPVQAEPTASTSAPAAADAVVVKPSYERELSTQLDAANSYATVKHLVETIGPRYNGTPQEKQGATYLAQKLRPYGFEVEVQEWGPVSTRRAADLSATVGTLPGNPKWQLATTPRAVMTGSTAITAPVFDAGTGQDPAQFVGAASRIVVVTLPRTPAQPNLTAIDNAVAAGARAVIVMPTVPATGRASVSLPAIPATTNYPIPVMGGSSEHSAWMAQALAAGPLSLRFTTNEYVNPVGYNYIATRKAVDDRYGSKAPIVMVGAHIDSVLGSPGGHDDATGNGVSTEIGRVLSQLPYDKEIRIGGFGGEEGGLLGARAYVATLSADERARFVGEWQMDMVGTPYPDAKLWALTPNGATNFVVDEAYEAAARSGYTGLQNCRLGQSDHQAFYDVGIPSALFIWLDYRPNAAGCTNGNGSYTTEPSYHTPADNMANVSQERMQITLDVIGPAIIQNALNALDLTLTTASGDPLDDTAVTVDCGDGPHEAGTTDAEGRTLTHVPAGTCTVHAEDGTSVLDQEVELDGDTVAALELDDQAPTIDLAFPSDGASYALGTTVRAEYTCADNVPAGLTCVGDVRDGGSLDTSTAGDFAFTVTATDAAGNATTRKVAYKVVAPSPAAAPALSAVGGSSTYGEVPSISVSVAGSTANGTIEVRHGSEVLATAGAALGVRRVTLPRGSVRPGDGTLQVALVGADGKDVTTTTTEHVVARAPSSVSVRSGRVTSTRRLKVSVELPSTLAPSEATGRIVVRRGGKVVGRARAVAGLANVKLDLGRKSGKTRLSVTYVGNDVVAPSKVRARVRVLKA